jgi:hypothetical protein
VFCPDADNAGFVFLAISERKAFCGAFDWVRLPDARPRDGPALRSRILAGTKEGTILGHEGVGIVEEIGPHVRNVKAGDRVVPSTIACGTCAYCRSSYYSKCK